MPVKKTANTKKRGPGRPKGSKNKTAPAKKTAARRGRPPGSKNKNSKVKDVKKPKSKRGGFHREINEVTGFVVDTDQDFIATALLEGGESRGAIVEYCYANLDNETRNGTEKQITNMVSAVLNKMLAAGYTIESSFQVVPPTAASKRAATRAANSATKKATPAKKTPAKKTAAKKTAAKKTPGKRGPGRPKGSKNKK